MNTSRLLALAAISSLGLGQLAAAGSEPPMHMHKAQMTHGNPVQDVVPEDEVQAAEYYRQEAALLSSKATQHRAQAKVFANRTGAKVDGRQLARHCEKLAASYEKAAKEAAAIADALSK